MMIGCSAPIAKFLASNPVGEGSEYRLYFPTGTGLASRRWPRVPDDAYHPADRRPKDGVQ